MSLADKLLACMITNARETSSFSLDHVLFVSGATHQARTFADLCCHVPKQCPSHHLTHHRSRLRRRSAADLDVANVIALREHPTYSIWDLMIDRCAYHGHVMKGSGIDFRHAHDVGNGLRLPGTYQSSK